MPKTMKNRGLARYITSGIGEWKLPKQFSAVYVMPFVHGNFPHATLQSISSALNYAVVSNGTLEAIGRAVFAKRGVEEKIDGMTDDIIDEALAALAKVEAALNRQKTMRIKMDEMRRLLNGG